MKKSIYVLLLALCFACGREENTSVIPAMDVVDSAAIAVQTGQFTSTPGEMVSGGAKIVVSDGKYSLILDPFSSSNGPDLHVYLAEKAGPGSFIDLGKLKSTTGTQVYQISGKPDFSRYKFALIHCQQYNHLFGSAALQ